MWVARDQSGCVSAGSFSLQLALVVLMVTLIHFIEAYGLNPAIYSAHLKLHPLLVLTVLVVAEHSLGVWGLLLAGAFLSPSIYCHRGRLEGSCSLDSRYRQCRCRFGLLLD